MNSSTLTSLPGAPFFHHHDGQLCIEQVALSDLARQHGTPLFAYSKAAILDALSAYQRGFSGRKSLICYAMKANSTLGVLKVLKDAGCGFDIVSGGELARVLAVGAQPHTIIFSGVGKTRAEMRQALEVGIGCFNVESDAELEVLNAVAMELGQRARISIRVNPNVDPQTHPYISTGLKGNKFGVAHDHALATYQRAAALSGLQVVGIDCHIGSQITTTAPYLEAMDRMLDLVDAIEASGIALQHIDFGGGLGIAYNGEKLPDAQDLWVQLLQKIDARGHRAKHLLIEPGRSLVGNAGVCVSEVLYLKHGEDKNFCIIDAAMNDLPRPAMYQAFHHIEPLQVNPSVLSATYDVVGPVCESGDWIGRDRSLGVKAGDKVAVMSAGAYCMSMASNYNTRNRAVELLIDGDSVQVIRRRESVADQVALESF